MTSVVRVSVGFRGGRQYLDSVREVRYVEGNFDGER